MKINKKILAMLIAALFVTAACADSDSDSDGSSETGGVDTAVIDASSGDWVYLSLRTGEEVTVSNASTSSGWDLGFNGAKIRTNGGTSGPGSGGAFDSGVSELDDITDTDVSFEADQTVSVLTGPPPAVEWDLSAVLYGCDYLQSPDCDYEGWYDYDSTTHVVSPKDKAFIVACADETPVKFKITGYSSSVYNLEWETVE